MPGSVPGRGFLHPAMGWLRPLSAGSTRPMLLPRVSRGRPPSLEDQGAPPCLDPFPAFECDLSLLPGTLASRESRR